MMTITLDRWQVAALAASVLVLVVLAIVLGFLLATFATSGAVAPVPSAVVAGGLQRGQERAEGDDLAARTRSRLRGSFEVQDSIRETADQAGDTVQGGAELIIDPLAHGAGAAAKRFLPKWMAGSVAAASRRASVRAKNKLVYGTEHSVRNTLGGAVYGDGDGAAAPQAAPARRYAIELGRFAAPSNAESFAAAAARRGVACTVDYAPEPGQAMAYAVRTGRYAVAEEASSALDALARESGIAGTVVPLAEPGGQAAP